MKYLHGTSIIEVIIATALISVAIISALSLVNSSQKQNTYARNLAEATRYANQAVDWIRSQRDALSWDTLASETGGIYCLNTIPSSPNDFTDLTLTPCDDGDYISNTLFQRQIDLDTTQKGSGIVKISVSVTWVENTARQANIEMELTKWN